MNTGRWDRISGLLERALDLEPAARRELYARECVDDPSLAEEVERMVAADTSARGFLEAAAPLRAVPPAQPLAAGARIGGYTLIRRIGVGGMGVVFEASQERPHRRVALKLVQSVFASPATLLRFRYEAEALGRLRHSGIAQVYEAGVDVDAQGDERPFLAMEFVEDARPITEYVRERALGYRRIVELFRGVCAAVQHGHERGVLHRDIKASNVLVDATGVPKLIDFGIAKVLGEIHTRATEAGEIVGTLAYMSPEQLEGDLEILDVRSDVYALGALLYELVCGRPVLDLKGLSISEALIRARKANHASPSSVRPDLPIELEWIVLRALESERDRRYASAADFARDLDRYLGDEPVLASPPSTVYRARKFVRRNRVVVAASVAILLTVVAGAVAALIQRDRAVIAKERAEQAEGLANDRLARLEVEARTNRELAEFQGRILTSADPDIGGRDARVVDVLASASIDLDAKTDLEPRIWLALRRSIVDAYVSLSLPREVRGELERMQPVWEAEYAPDDVERLALERIALENEVNFEPPRLLMPRVLAGLARAMESTRSDACEVARWRILAGLVGLQLGGFEEAEGLIRSGAAALETKFGPTSSPAVTAKLTLASALNGLRRLEEAEALTRQVYEACLEEYGRDHRLTLEAEQELAFAVGVLGRTDEALELHREVIGAHERRSGPGSTAALEARSHLAEFLRLARRPAEALTEIETVLRDGLATIGENNSFVHRARCRRAAALMDLERLEEAAAGFEEALRGATDHLGPDDSTTIDIESQYAFALFRLGRFESALPHCRDVWLKSRRVLGDENGFTLGRGNGYAVVLANVGRQAESIPVLEWLLSVQDRTLGPSNEDSILTLKNLTMIRLDGGDVTGAVCSAEELVERAESASEGEYPRAAGAHWALGHALRKNGDLEGAAEHMAIASDRWAHSVEAGSEIAIFGLIDEATVLGELGRTPQRLEILERAAAMAGGRGLSPSIRSRALTEYAEALQSSGEVERARGLAEMILAGSTEIEPKIRARAQRVLDPG
ncbi:MAG: serine/threonine-protein kinase [Planctomycetota bacterium]|nr:serine/threonine-protein kinase [Planctomycetota bacterium]